MAETLSSGARQQRVFTESDVAPPPHRRRHGPVATMVRSCPAVASPETCAVGSRNQDAAVWIDITGTGRLYFVPDAPGAGIPRAGHGGLAGGIAVDPQDETARLRQVALDRWERYTRSGDLRDA